MDRNKYLKKTKESKKKKKYERSHDLARILVINFPKMCHLTV